MKKAKDPLLSAAGRLGAYTLHAAGGTTTTAARAARQAKLEAIVDPTGELDPAERATRARHELARQLAVGRLKAAQTKAARSSRRRDGRNLEAEA